MKSPGTVFRKANGADIDMLVSLLKELFALEADFTFNAKLQKQGLALLLQNRDTACIMVAETEGRVVGMCTAQLVVSTAEGAQSAWVEVLFVNAAYHRPQIGTQLLQAVEQWAVRKGATRLQLLADRDNRSALDFYHKKGWSLTQLICLKRLPSSC